MLIDTHCHLTYPGLAERLDDVLARAAAAGVQRIVTVATTPADARSALALMAGRPQIHLAAGVHPHEAGQCDAVTLAELTALHRAAAGYRAPAAVGETGLDFYYNFATPERQEEVFRYQLSLACEVYKPVIIHARNSEERVCEILRDYPRLRGRVVFHCFSGGAALARRILDMDFWLSFTGVVTFKNGDEVRQAARLVPLDRIMVETDAPYLSPEPVRKVRPNEPAHVAHTARFLAELRGMDFADFAAVTTANAERFFQLSAPRAAAPGEDAADPR